MLANLNKTTNAPNEKKWCENIIWGLIWKKPVLRWFFHQGAWTRSNFARKSSLRRSNSTSAKADDALGGELGMGIADHRVGDTKLWRRKSAAWGNAIPKLNHGLCKLTWCRTGQHHRLKKNLHLWWWTQTWIEAVAQVFWTCQILQICIKGSQQHEDCNRQHFTGLERNVNRPSSRCQKQALWGLEVCSIFKKANQSTGIMFQSRDKNDRDFVTAKVSTQCGHVGKISSMGHLLFGCRLTVKFTQANTYSYTEIYSTQS